MLRADAPIYLADGFLAMPMMSDAHSDAQTSIADNFLALPMMSNAPYSAQSNSLPLSDDAAFLFHARFDQRGGHPFCFSTIHQYQTADAHLQTFVATKSLRFFSHTWLLRHPLS